MIKRVQGTEICLCIFQPDAGGVRNITDIINRFRGEISDYYVVYFS